MSETGNAGFTLLEMMVTLAILALIAGIGYPALSRATDHVAFLRAVRDAQAGLRVARALAIKYDMPVSLRLTSDGRWQAGNRILGAPLPPDVQATLAPVGIAFYGDGTARPGALRLGNNRETWSAQIEASGLIQ